LPLQKVVTRQIRLQGSCASAGEYPQAIEYVASGKIQVKPLITAVAPLEQGPRWFERLYSREPNLMKVVLTPGEGLLVDGGISTGATKALVQQETVQQKTIQQK
jgi:L-iditol 2-dehydrogenase